MGDLRNKARKEAQVQDIRDAHDRLAKGWTVFHFSFAPSSIRRDMSVDEAIRHLLQVTGTRISFWRCPVRGFAVKFVTLSRTSFSFDKGETYKNLTFSTLEDVNAAKQELVISVLLQGIQNYRGLPNGVYEHQVRIITALLTAPPSVDREEWLKMKSKLHPWIRPLIDARQAELRCNLLGEPNPDARTGSVEFSARLGLPRRASQKSQTGQ